MAVLISRQGLIDFLSIKIRPENVGKVELAISRLRLQEVAEACLSTGTDDQVGVGQVGSVKIFFESILAQILCRNAV